MSTPTNDADDDLLLVRDACAYISRLTGKTMTDKAFRIAVDRAAAAARDAGQEPPLAPVTTSPQRYRRGDLREFARTPPRRGGRKLPELPGLYNTNQAANAIGVTPQDWRQKQSYPPKLNPPPRPVPVDRIPAEHRWAPFYEPEEVHEFGRKRTGHGNWGSHPNPADAAAGKGWTSEQCAAHGNTTVENWRYRVQQDRKRAQHDQRIQPIDRVGRSYVWDPTAVENYWADPS